MVVKTKENQIVGAYGYLYKNGNYNYKKNFYFNITNKELKIGQIYLTLNNEGIYVDPYFRLGKRFFTDQNIICKEYQYFSCKEVEVFEINLQ